MTSANEKGKYEHKQVGLACDSHILYPTLPDTLISPSSPFLLTTNYAHVTSVDMLQKDNVPIYTANCLDGINITNWEEQSHPSSRGTRAVDHSTRLLLVSINKKIDDHILRQSLASWVHEGIEHNGAASVHIPCSRCDS